MYGFGSLDHRFREAWYRGRGKRTLWYIFDRTRTRSIGISPSICHANADADSLHPSRGGGADKNGDPVTYKRTVILRTLSVLLHSRLSQDFGEDISHSSYVVLTVKVVVVN